ncbi:MAG: hypothetical protein MRJ52_06270 [Nitrosomonas sp.]|nr:hypothetical protein [Nitrosomonas sp.]
MLRLIRQFLERDILAEARRWTPVKGTPQGAVQSVAGEYLLAYLTKLAEEAIGWFAMPTTS